MESQEKQYKYYAFISYSRKNSKAAKYLHKQLEHFRVPVKYVAKENLPQHQKFLRPVFRDRRDLEVGESSFTNDIKVAIEQSRYLIVLCSPKSAASIYVNDEIKHFLATHNNDYNAIVPVILNGEPGSGGDDECLPEALRCEEITMRNRPSMIPDEGDDEKTGWENGVVQAMSYMLKVQREKIKATVDAEKVRQMKIYAVIGVVAMIVFALLAGWALHAERQASANEKRAIAGELEAKQQAERAERERREAKKQAEFAKKNLGFITTIFQFQNVDKRINKTSMVLDSIDATISDVEKLQDWKLKANVLTIFSSICGSLGDFDKALKLSKQAYGIYYKNLPNSLEEAECLYIIGQTLYIRNKFDQALEYFTKSLDIHIKVSGKSHGYVAKCYSNIGYVYTLLHKNKEAFEYHLKALEIYEQIFEGNHPLLAQSYHDIGELYGLQGQFEQATKYFNKALEIRIKAFGEFHALVADCYNNIGSICAQQGKTYEAFELHQKALKIREQIFEKNHPAVAQSYHNIGEAYGFQGQFERALEYFTKSLDIRVNVFGEYHFSVAECHNNIGICYAQLKKIQKALEHHLKALKIREQIFEKNHPAVALSYYNIGEIYGVQGQQEQALEYLKKSLEIRIKAFGESHVSVADCYNNIGVIYGQQKNFNKALECHLKSLKIRKRVLKENHPAVALSHYNIGEIYGVQGQLDQALEYYQKALVVMKNAFGENHPHTQIIFSKMKGVEAKKRGDKTVISARFIAPESAAEKSGIKSGDIIINYAGSDWTADNVKTAPDIQRVRNIEKQLIFARKKPDGSFHIFSKTFPAGMMGIAMNGTLVNIKDYNKIMEAYKKFQEQQKK